MPEPTLAEALLAMIKHIATVADAAKAMLARIEALEASPPEHNHFDGVPMMAAELAKMKDAVAAIDAEATP